MRLIPLLSACVLAATALPVTTLPAAAQTRTVLQQYDIPESGYVAAMTITELKAGQTAPRHTHPGIEMTYVLEGEGDLSVEGQPVLHIKPQDHFMVPARVPHSVKAGDKPMKMLVIFIIEKGKPLATPAPK